jgi:hypothetical protein
MKLSESKFSDLRHDQVKEHEQQDIYRPGRIADTPGMGNPDMKLRISRIAQATWLESFRGCAVGATAGLLGLFLSTRAPQFRKHWQPRIMLPFTLCGMAFGSFLASATTLKNTLALDLQTNPRSTGSPVDSDTNAGDTLGVTDYQKKEIQRHNSIVDFDASFERRKRAIENRKVVSGGGGSGSMGPDGSR